MDRGSLSCWRSAVSQEPSDRVPVAYQVAPGPSRQLHEVTSERLHTVLCIRRSDRCDSQRQQGVVGFVTSRVETIRGFSGRLIDA
jgi:hypothetical protein